MRSRLTGNVCIAFLTANTVGCWNPAVSGRGRAQLDMIRRGREVGARIKPSSTEICQRFSVETNNQGHVLC